MKQVDRRAFLKMAGFGSLASAALLESIANSTPASADALAAAVGGRPTTFDLATVASAGIYQGHKFQIFLTGEGTVSARSVVGTGRFVVFDQLAPVPRPVVLTGSWAPRKLLATEVIGTLGALAAGEI